MCVHLDGGFSITDATCTSRGGLYDSDRQSRPDVRERRHDTDAYTNPRDPSAVDWTRVVGLCARGAGACTRLKQPIAERTG